MWRIECKRQMNWTTRRGDVRWEALMVFYVAGWQVVGMLAFEFGKQLLRCLAEDINQHIEAATVCHADHDFLYAFFTGALDGFIHWCNEALAALQRKPLLADIFGMEIALQTFGCGQAIENMLFLFGWKTRCRTRRFESFLYPPLFARIADVHELDTDWAAIGIAQSIEQVAQRCRFGTEIGITDIEHDVHIGIGKAVKTRLQFRDIRTFLALQRIEIGPMGTQKAIGSNQLRCSDPLAPHLGIGWGGHSADRTLLGALCEWRNHGRMCNVRLCWTIGGRHVLHRIKIRTPIIGNRTGIIEVGLVQFFNVRGVTSKQIRVGEVLLHHLLLTFLRVSRD